MAVIDMQRMRYINLLDKASRVKTSRCFVHNNTIFFAVRRKDVSKAIGPAAANIRKMQDSLGKKVKIIGDASGIEDLQRFIEDIVSPVKPKSIEVKDGLVLITAGSNQNKAILIGRNRRRYDELRRITMDYFNLDLKIV